MTDIYTHGGETAARYDFSVNLNPLGMPQSAKAAYIRAADELGKYPDRHAAELSRKISEKEGYPAEHILCGAGAADLICRTVFAAKPEKALVMRPSFTEYERALTAAGCGICFCSADMLINSISCGTDMVFVCSPNNPTGMRLPEDELIELSERCRECGALLIIDESFIFFCKEKNPTRTLYENGAVIIRSLTKIYAMPALRIGYLICKDTALRERICMCGQSWSTGTAAVRAASAALSEEGFIRRSVEYVERERAYLSDGLRSYGLEIFPSEVNFVLVRTDMPLRDMLLRYDISVRDCTDMFGAKGYFRIAVRTHEENEHLINILRCINAT